MIDVRAESIIYQSQIYYRDLINDLQTKKRLGKAYDSYWRKADEILGYLEALNYRDKLTDEDDILNVNHILECLIKLCELNHYPVSAPIEFQAAPSVIVGSAGDKGDTGDRGATGATGLATDFNVSLISSPTTVDSFNVSASKGARWDFMVLKSTGEQRLETLIGTWNTTGSSIEFYSDSTADIVGSTSALTMSVSLSGSTITLIATPASGQWTVTGTRYFVPNNGNGTGPISDSLADGTIFIGNGSGLAQSRSVTGVLAITNTGVTSFAAGAIVNADVNASAAIAFSKMAVLTADKVLVSTGGVVTASATTSTTLGYLDIGSSLTTLLAAKLTDPTTTAGDIIIRNGANTIARLGVGSNGQVLTLSGGVPTWQSAGTGFADPMTSIGDIIIRNGANATARLGIGSASQVLTVSSGVPAWTTPVYSTLTGVTSIAEATYTVLTTDHIVHMNNSAARTVTLPDGATVTAGKIFWIKDSAGSAGTNAITVQRAGADTFEGGGTSITIIGDRSVQGVYWGDSRWNII